jgi:hypothetical protein
MVAFLIGMAPIPVHPQDALPESDQDAPQKAPDEDAPRSADEAAPPSADEDAPPKSDEDAPLKSEGNAPRKPDEPTAADVANAPVPGSESGRADNAREGDSLLRNIGQGALTVPRAALEVTMAPVRASIWALDRYRVVDRWKQLFFDDSYTYGLYPTAVLDSSYGLTVGARFVHRNVFGHREHFSLRGSTGGEFRAQAVGGFRTGQLFGERAHIELRTELERRPQDAYYGIGNGTDDTAAYHRQELLRARTIFDLLTVDSLHLRAAGAITDLEYGRSEDGEPIDMMFDPSTLPGWSGVRNVYGELEVRWDRRGFAWNVDRYSVFDRGFLLAAYMGRVHQLEAGADHWRYGGEAQKFFALGRGPRVFSTRLHVEGVTGNIDDVAFTELPQLGGKMLLRGYPRDRFRDRFAALTSFEYSWDLGKFPRASVFADVGRVFPDVREIEQRDLRIGYGFTLQLFGDPDFIASLSIASSVDGGLFIDLAFDPVFDIEPRVEQR